MVFINLLKVIISEYVSVFLVSGCLMYNICMCVSVRASLVSTLTKMKSIGNVPKREEKKRKQKNVMIVTIVKYQRNKPRNELISKTKAKKINKTKNLFAMRN